MMCRVCQDYCGGYVDLTDAYFVGRYDELFYLACYGRWLRMQYAGQQPDFHSKRGVSH